MREDEKKEEEERKKRKKDVEELEIPQTFKHKIEMTEKIRIEENENIFSLKSMRQCSLLFILPINY